MLEFEQYLNDFNATINIWSLALNFLIVSAIAVALKYFYIHFGRAISDRKKFSNNFLPLALGTLLIITVIKSSIALSLGLVGALSIVRFRSAIKDPEELTMLFLVIGLGLMGGADKPILAIFSFAVVIPTLYLNSKLANTKSLVHNKAYLHVTTSLADVTAVTSLVEPHTTHLELKRLDKTEAGLIINYLCTLEDPKQLQQILTAIEGKDADAVVSFVEQPDLLV